MMSYKGYYASVELDSTAKIFHGKVLGINDVVTFQGTAVQELEAEFHASVDDYLEFCAKEGKTPEITLSGTLNLRMGPEKHRMVKVFAEQEKRKQVAPNQLSSQSPAFRLKKLSLGNF